MSYINHSSSESREIFFFSSEARPCTGYFIVCMDTHFTVAEFDNTFQLSTVSSPFKGCQGSCDIVPKGDIGLIVSVNTQQG